MSADVRPSGIQPMSKAEAAYQRLRHEIRSGQLAPGERVTLHQLSTALQMSLTPVREALNALAAEGFVVQEPYRGTFIAAVDRQRIEQVYRLREVLEPMAVSLAAQRVDLEDLNVETSRLCDLLAACDQATTPLDVVQRNEEFHRALYSLSGDDLLMGFIEKLWAGVPYQSLSLYGLGERVAESSREHHAVLSAVLVGDAETAASSMQSHIKHGRAAALGRL